MTREAVPVDISTMPEVARLVREMARDGRPRRLREAGTDLAILSPARIAQQRRGARVRFVGTGDLPPVPYRAVDELLASRPAYTGRTITDEEIKAGLEEERVEAWRRKSS